jgi:hypothetical protein
MHGSIGYTANQASSSVGCGLPADQPRCRLCQNQVERVADPAAALHSGRVELTLTAKNLARAGNVKAKA